MKNITRFIGALLALSLLGNTVYGEIPYSSVIIGNKGFSLAYVNDPVNQDEIRNLLKQRLPLIIKTRGKWFRVDGSEFKDLSTLPQITFKDKDGNISEYGEQNGVLLSASEEKLEYKGFTFNSSREITVHFDDEIDSEIIGRLHGLLEVKIDGRNLPMSNYKITASGNDLIIKTTEMPIAGIVDGLGILMINERFEKGQKLVLEISDNDIVSPFKQIIDVDKNFTEKCILSVSDDTFQGKIDNETTIIELFMEETFDSAYETIQDRLSAKRGDSKVKATYIENKSERMCYIIEWEDGIYSSYDIIYSPEKSVSIQYIEKSVDLLDFKNRIDVGKRSDFSAIAPTDTEVLVQVLDPNQKDDIIINYDGKNLSVTVKKEGIYILEFTPVTSKSDNKSDNIKNTIKYLTLMTLDYTIPDAGELKIIKQSKDTLILDYERDVDNLCKIDNLFLKLNGESEYFEANVIEGNISIQLIDDLKADDYLEIYYDDYMGMNMFLLGKEALGSFRIRYKIK